MLMFLAILAQYLILKKTLFCVIARSRAATTKQSQISDRASQSEILDCFVGLKHSSQ